MLKAFIVLALLTIPASAHAKTFKLGGDHPVAEITVPDSWQTDLSDGSLEAVAPETSARNSSAYVSAEMFDAADLAEAGQATGQFLKEQKIQVKPASQTKTQRKIAGLEASDASWDATDEDGPTRFRISLIKVKPGKMLLLTYWRSEAGEAAHKGEVEAIENSIKPIK